KEYVARGTYIFPAGPSMRLVTDMFAHCARELPNFNTISISGYHIREAGATAAQELAFTLSNARAYVRAAQGAGLAVDEFAPRLSFFFACHNRLLEEVAKFRVARRMWARLMRDEFGAKEPKSQMLRFHTQTGGSTLTAQQPNNNVVRTAYQALAAVLGGTQSLHTNALDEALGLPTPESASLALRTQQILAYETGVPDAIDPLAGSYYIEQLCDELEAEALALMGQVEDLGGAVQAIEAGFVQREIEESAYRFQQAIESGERVVVGVNRFAEAGGADVPIQVIDPELEPRRTADLAAFRAARDGVSVSGSLLALRRAAEGEGGGAPGGTTLFVLVQAALARHATLGEVCGVLREAWGEYHG
ncbi:MAG TPA: methylmalonyl-CoA mutase family protein, partial [Trueperaceae bacterium]|nr:methylmalonyl-CoA mutase family protein [Trueperaceae bacterium]